MHYVYLLIAIVAEVVATSSLKATDSFTKIVPSAIVIIGYGAAFYFLTLALRSISTATTRRSSLPSKVEPAAT